MLPWEDYMLKWLQLFSGNKGMRHWTTLLLRRPSTSSTCPNTAQCGFCVLLQSQRVTLHCLLLYSSYPVLSCYLSLKHPLWPQHPPIHTHSIIQGLVYEIFSEMTPITILDLW